MINLPSNIQNTIDKYWPFLSNRVFKATSWYMVGTIIEKAIYVLGVGLLTRLLSPDQYGTVSLFTTWTGLFVVIFSLNLRTALRRFYHDNDEATYRDYVSSALLFGFAVCGSIIVGLWLLPDSWFEPIFSMRKSFVLLAGIAVLLEYPMQVMRSVWWETYQYKANVIYTIILALLSIILSVVFILLIPEIFADRVDVEYGRIYGIIITHVVLLAALPTSRAWFGKWRINWTYIRTMLAFALPLLPSALSMLVLAQFDRIVIDAQVGRFETGLYSYGYQIGLIFYMIIFATNKAWSPWFMEKMGQQHYNLLVRRNRQYVLVMALFTVFAILISPLLVLIIAGSEYSDATRVSPVVVASTYFLFLYALLSTYLMYEKMTWSISFGTIIASVLNIILNVALIPQFGYVIAAWTTLTSYGCLFLIYWIIAQRRFPQDKPLFPVSLMLVLGILLSVWAALISLIQW